MGSCSATTAAGRWPATFEELGLPSSVRDVVGRRVERLGDEALRVLGLAAVIGREFDLDLLAALADVGEDPLLDLLDAGVSAAVLVESDTADRYRFAHALTQHTLYDELSPARRQRAHQRVADALEEQATGDDAATLAELAHHWVAATRPADLDKALGYVRRAGDAARAALAPDDAIGWYRQPSSSVDSQAAPDQRQRAELLAVLGTTQLEAGHAEGREALLRAAALGQALDDTDLLVRAALGFTSWAPGRTGDEDALPVIQAALDRVGTDPTPTRARLLAALACAHDSNRRERQDLAVDALDTARRTADEATLAEVLDMTFMDIARPARRDEVIDDIERAATMADRIGDPVLQARITYHLLWARCQQADQRGADGLLAGLEALSETIGLPFQDFQTAIVATGRLLLAGDVDRAEASNERALERGLAAGSPDAFGAYGGYLYAIRLHQGRLEEIADLFIDAARDSPSIAALRAAVTAMLSHLGRLDEATDRLAAEAAAGFDYPEDETWLASMADLLDAAVTTGDHAVARELVDRVAPFADHISQPAPAFVVGAVARPLGRAATLLGDHDRAEAWFAIAHDLHTRLRAPYWAARGQLDHADLCLARRGDGDVDRARELATTAAATGDEYGCAGLITRAEALLAGL